MRAQEPAEKVICCEHVQDYSGLFALSVSALLAGCAGDPRQLSDSPSGSPSPHNVIVFVGDGMGVSTVTATRIFAGQAQGASGEEHQLSFEKFDNVALIKTYTTDRQVPDSAGTMTAIMTGRKTRSGSISVSASVNRNNCAAALENPLPTLMEQAEDAGFVTGVISTARVTHATPAVGYAHSPNRNWEADTDMPPAAIAAGCRDIASQLLEFDHGDGIEVVLGGGRRYFLPRESADPEYPEQRGVRGDQQDLMALWRSGRGGHAVWNTTQLEQIPEDDGPVLGLFSPSHMQFEADRNDDPGGEPSLAEMTRFTIARLQRLQDPRIGFFLVVEGGRIDHAHHAGNAYRALTDAVEFAEAVQVAMDMTSIEDTQILVTADHSHTFTISGYPRRGNPILGKVMSPLGELAQDQDGRPYTTLGYANGPGYRTPLTDLRNINTEDRNYRQVAAIPMAAETHSGEDVAAYARGPNADTLRGVMEQNELYQVLRGALFPADDEHSR